MVRGLARPASQAAVNPWKGARGEKARNCMYICCNIQKQATACGGERRDRWPVPAARPAAVIIGEHEAFYIIFMIPPP